MKQILIFLFLFSGLNTFSNELVNQLIERREQIKQWMLLCEGEFEGQASNEPGACKQWDMIEFAGNACLSAQLAGDRNTVRDRCSDVEKGQGPLGQWWRGESNINKTTKNSFSRDMMYGVINYFISQGILNPDQKKQEDVRQRAMKWIDWIEKYGKGKAMCNDNVGFFQNSCQTRKSQILYHVLKKLGAINKSNQHYKFVKRAKKHTGLNGWQIETYFTKVGYPLFLKNHQAYQKYMMGVISAKEYKLISRIIYRKDPHNAWYEFMHLGPTARNIQKTLERCPVKRPKRDAWTLRHFSRGDYQFQRAEKDRAWEVTDGHDCIGLINWQIAALTGKISLPFATPSSCGVKKELGIFKGLKVCRAVLPKKISEVKCGVKNGVHWDKDGKTYCLQNRGKYYLAKKMKKVCPSGHRYTGLHKGMPVCEKKNLKKIRLYRCNRIGMGEYIGTGSEIIRNEAGEITGCYVYKSKWYQKRKVSKLCPIGFKATGEFVSDWAPICNSPLRITEKNCKKPGKWNIAKEDHCLVRKKGWFAKRSYK